MHPEQHLGWRHGVLLDDQHGHLLYRPDGHRVGRTDAHQAAIGHDHGAHGALRPQHIEDRHRSRVHRRLLDRFKHPTAAHACLLDVRSWTASVRRCRYQESFQYLTTLENHLKRYSSHACPGASNHVTRAASSSTTGRMCARDDTRSLVGRLEPCLDRPVFVPSEVHHPRAAAHRTILDIVLLGACLLYTSDAADERSSVDLGGRRIIKKKKEAVSLKKKKKKKENTHK